MNKDEANCRHCGHMRWWGTPGCAPIRSEYGENMSRQHEWIIPVVGPTQYYRTNALDKTNMPVLSWLSRMRKWAQALWKRLFTRIVWWLEVSEYAAIVRSTHVGCRGRRCTHCNSLVDMMITKKQNGANDGKTNTTDE